jgi:hypothetical protein
MAFYRDANCCQIVPRIVYVISGGKSAALITLMWGLACMLEFSVSAISVRLRVVADIGMYKSQFFSCYSFRFRVFGIANGLWVGRSGTRIPLGEEIFMFS